MIEGLKKRFHALCLVLLGAICLAVIPAVGYAEDYDGGGGGSHNFGGSYPNFGTVWFDKTAVSNGLDVSPIRVRYGVVAYSNWDAAMYCLRGTSFTDSDLTSTKKSKLLGNSDFNTLGNLFKVGKPEATNDWAGDASITLAWNSARELYGETYCYSAIYTMDQWYAADAALRRIMNEDDTSGGGGDVGGGVLNTEDLPDQVRLLRIRDIPVAQWQSVTVDISSIMDLSLDAETYPYCFVQMFSKGVTDANYPVDCRVELCFVQNDDFEYYWDSDRDAAVFVSPTYTRGYTFYANGVLQSDGTMEAPLERWSGTSWSSGAGAVTVAGNGSTQPVIYASYITRDYTGGGGDEPTEPPTTWPDPPDDPYYDPPDIPGPGDPTVPIDPTPPDPWSPIPGIDIEINGDDFQDLLDALNEHCIHLQTSIQDNISQLWSLQSALISDRFDWLGNDVIIPSFTDLKDYLQQLFEWLAERMNFNLNYTNGAYDDSSVITWLKKIWSKMGDGINTQPTDPVQESDDWWAWLLALMSNFVAMLLSFGSDRLGDVMNGLSSLTGKFPFSLPWDLLALLAMLDAPAQVPGWDLPCFAVSLDGLQQVSTYHISLEDYDTVWENVRWIERLSFVVLLVRSTDLFTGMMRRAVGNRD